MRRPLTLGVLSTSFGGAYFGELMASIAARQAMSGGRLVAIQTLDAGTYKRDVANPPAFPHRVAWDHLSGAVVLPGPPLPVNRNPAGRESAAI